MALNIDRLLRGASKASRRARGLLWTVRIRAFGGTVGSRLEVDRRAVMRWPAHAGIELGNDVYLGIGVILDVPKEAEILVGHNVKVMQYSVIAASMSISIGNWTQIAEFCSIRDSDHGVMQGKPMQLQSVATPTVIGNDVWIARGVAVLRGSMIQDGAVVGANAVVRGSIPPNAIAIGVPATVRKFR